MNIQTISSDQYRFLVETARDYAIFMLDTNGYIKTWNEGAEFINGYRAEEIIGKHFSVFYTKEDQQTKKPQRELDIAVNTGKYEEEGWRVKKDGSFFWTNVVITSMYDNENRLIGFSKIARDLTEKKFSEEALRATEERYRLFVEQVKDYAIFMLDKNGNISSWNEGAERIKGYQRDEVLGKHFSIFYPKEDLDNGKPAKELEIAKQTGKYEEEGWRLRKDGSRFWANVLITAIYKGNELVGYSKVTRDLTERKFSEEMLRATEERHRLFVEQVKDYAIYTLDKNGNISTWNEGAKRIKGYPRDEVLGKHFSIFYLKEDLDNGKPARELESAKQKGRYEEEGWRVRKDGSRFWANVLITAIYKENELVGYSKITRDLTERNRAEEALKRSNQRFQQIAEELSLANKQLQIANRDLEQFASIASHDLKEPLRKIGMFTDLVLSDDKDNLSEKSKMNMQKTIEASRRMSLMIEDILEFSILSQKKPFEVVSLERILKETIEVLEQPIKEKNALVKSDDLPDARVIVPQFRQLFQNLLSNSLKFSKDGISPEINITHSYIPGESVNGNDPNQERQLQISVTDNGIGFGNEHVENIFGLFKRLHDKNKYEGTGLGLAICKKVVENHGGTITANSESDKGASFIIKIPA